jgi:hypothetical protein
MSVIDQLIADTFAVFEKERDPAPLYEVLDSMEAAEARIAAEDVLARKQAILHRLHFFALLDQAIDSAWSAQDIPAQGVPPPSTHGVIFSSGEVDPKSIPDPEERARYMQALKANKEAQQEYYVQMQLRRIDERAMRCIGQLLDELENHELEPLLAASRVDPARASRVRALSR